MSVDKTKAQILDDLRDTQAQFEALLAEIGEEHMTQPIGAGDWSIKDVVAHLNGWDRRLVELAQAALRNEPAPPTPWPPHLHDDDEINAWIYAASRDRSVDDVLRDAHDIRLHLVETLEALPEADLHDPTRFTWFEGQQLSGADFYSYAYSHLRDDHEPDMRAWLDRVKREER